MDELDAVGLESLAEDDQRALVGLGLATLEHADGVNRNLRMLGKVLLLPVEQAPCGAALSGCDHVRRIGSLSKITRKITFRLTRLSKIDIDVFVRLI